MRPERKKQEENRRERKWDPRVRWRVIQDTITWAELQKTCRRNTREKQLEEEARKLSAWDPSGSDV